MSLIEYDLFRGEVDKIKIAIERLQEFEPPEGYYLAFSGGKDSVAIKALAEMAGVKFDAHYNVTTVDPPELIYFIRKYDPEVIFEQAEKPLVEKILDKGFPPLRQQRWCCEIYKEHKGDGRVLVLGVRKEESLKRSKRRMVETCYKNGSKRYVNPIIDWTTADVWEFIKSYELPYCNLYDEGFKRLGCVMCPMASGWVRRWEAERWPKIAASWKRWIVRLYDNRKNGPKPIYGHKDGEAYFEWWLSNKNAGNPDQTVIFE